SRTARPRPAGQLGDRRKELESRLFAQGEWLVAARALDVHAVLADEMACCGPRLRDVGEVPRPDWDVHASYVKYARATCQQVLRPVSPQAAPGTNEEPAVVARNPDGDAVGAPRLAPIGGDLALALPARGFDHVSIELGHRRRGTATRCVLFASTALHSTADQTGSPVSGSQARAA